MQKKLRGKDKMALKDWKKKKSNWGESEWKKGKRKHLLIMKASHYSPDKKGFVIQESTGGYYGNPFRKTFRTKASALKHAKSYMKKN